MKTYSIEATYLVMSEIISDNETLESANKWVTDIENMDSMLAEMGSAPAFRTSYRIIENKGEQ